MKCRAMCLMIALLIAISVSVLSAWAEVDPNEWVELDEAENTVENAEVPADEADNITPPDASVVPDVPADTPITGNADKTTYRALVIGIESYKTPLPGCANDARRVAATLQAANEGGCFYQAPQVKIDVNAEGLESALTGLKAWDIDEDDVTFVYFSGAALMNSSNTLAGVLGSDGAVYELRKFAAALGDVPGTKIVALNLILPKGRTEDGLSEQDACNKLLSIAVKAFEEAGKPGSEQYIVCFANGSATADLVNSVSGQQFSLSTYFLTQACGYDYANERPCDLLADANADGAVSVQELTGYITGKAQAFFSNGGLSDLSIQASSSAPDAEFPVVARRTNTQVLSITLDQAAFELPVQKSIRMTATVAPPNATDKTVYWTSSDLAVAAVDQQGNVMALRAGDCVITATAVNGLSVACDLKVRAVRRAESISMNQADIAMVTGGEIQAQLLTVPADINEVIFWRSADESVTEVTDTGLIKAKAVGTTTVTASTEGGLSASASVKVAQKGTVVEIIDLKEHSISLFEGDAVEIETRLTPANVKDKKLVFTTSDETIAKVSQNGTITGVKEGACTVTVTAQSGVRAECSVTVRGAVVEIKAQQFNMVVGRSAELEYRMIPERAKVQITWSSADESIVKVDQKGKVTAVGIGATTVSATTPGGAKTDCAVTVTYVPITEVKFKNSKATMTIGAIEEIPVRLKPDIAGKAGLAWQSSNPAVATVDQEGKVTAVSEGMTEITAVSQSGVGAKMQIEVIQVPVTKVELNRSVLSLTKDLEGTESDQLIAKTDPETAGQRGVTWKSSDEKVAIVNEEGKVVAVGDGKCIIRASAKGGSAYAECKVTVEPNRVEYAKPQTGDARKLYTSAKRIYYNDTSLVVDVYFVNRTKEAMALPKAGTLMLTWENGTDLVLMEIPQGEKKLGAGKSGVLTYEIPASVVGKIDIRKAQAAILTPEEVAAKSALNVPSATSDLSLAGKTDAKSPTATPESDFVDELTGN